MEIGEKIKSLRISKRMTQSELAGDQITRNMLSLVENGSALPSLPTIMYLSERLGVPAGMFLARESEEPVYRKMSDMPKIKSAYKSGEYRLCCEMCEGLFGYETDAIIWSEDDLREKIDKYKWYLENTRPYGLSAYYRGFGTFIRGYDMFMAEARSKVVKKTFLTYGPIGLVVVVVGGAVAIFVIYRKRRKAAIPVEQVADPVDDP